MPHNNHVFKDDTIILDGESFVGCLFKNCSIIYNGGIVPTIKDCKFEPPTKWQFGEAAARTISFLRALANINPNATASFESMMAFISGEVVSEDTEDITQQTFDYLASHAQHAIAIAKISALFASLEFQLCHVFAWMLQCYPLHAAAAYYQLQNNKARLDMIKGLLPCLHNDDERQGVTSIIEKAISCAKIRNMYCHALWQKKNDVIYVTENLATHYPYGTKRPITATAIISEANLVKKYCDEIGVLFQALTVKRPLVLAPEAIKPSYAPKFLGQSPRPDQSRDHQLPSKTEERSLQPQSFEEKDK